MVYFRAAWIVVSDLDDPNTRHHTRQVVQGQSWNKNRFWLEITGTNPVYVLIVVNGTRSTQRSANYSIHTYKHPTNRILLEVGKNGIKDDIPKTPFPLLILCGRNMLLNFPSMHPYVLSQTYSKSHHGPTRLRSGRSLQKMHRKL